MVDFKKLLNNPPLDDRDWDNVPDEPEVEDGLDPQELAVAAAPVEPDFISPWGTPIPTFTFLCGAAGSGKTYQTKLWREDVGSSLELCATTGIAALNLGGSTINSLLGYFDTESLQQKFYGGQLTGILRRLYKAGLRRIVLDEVSMLDGDQLTFLVRAIDDVNQESYFVDPDDEFANPNRDPLGLTLVGDFAQLSPVKAPYAFQSPEWHRFADHTHMLTEIKRQADAGFIQALRDARKGDGGAALTFLKPQMVATVDNDFTGTTLFANNETVDRYNQIRLDKLQTPLVFLASERWGKQRSEWGDPNKLPFTWGIPQRLPLKVGAWVMILTNVWIQGSRPRVPYYINGDCGELVDVNLETKEAIVKLQRGPQVRVSYCHREVVVPATSERHTEMRKLGLADKITEEGKEILGTIDYMPLRLAWGSTVHKSQGLSLDKVQMDISDPFFKTSGMLYVSLSRCRTVEGLRIVGRADTFITRCVADPKLWAWL